MNAWQLLPAVRELYSRLPEMYYRQPWELQHVLFSLGSPIEPRSILARWERSTPLLAAKLPLRQASGPPPPPETPHGPGSQVNS